VVRPISGVAVGIYADRVGRKAALMLTIFTMGLGTVLIVFAPTYASVGIWAPVLMVSARLLQGFACGGELGGPTAILVENAPNHSRGLYASWQTASQAAGVLLGAMVTMLVSLSMTQEQLEIWGWRLPFAFGLLIVPVGFYVRSRLSDPDLYLGARIKAPISSFARMLLRERHALVVGVGIAALYLACGYVLFIYMPTFAVRQLKMPFFEALIATTLASAVVLACCPIIAAISDRYGRKPLLMVGAATFATLTYPAFVLITVQPSLPKLAAVQIGFALAAATYMGPAISVYAELFPTYLRSTAVSLVYGVAVVLVGGFSPLIVTWLMAATGNPTAPAFYVIGAAAVSGVALLGLRDRFREPLPE
jgi:MHS family proline/betaine transporter-like MFS transporter